MNDKTMMIGAIVIARFSTPAGIQDAPALVTAVNSPTNCDVTAFPHGSTTPLPLTSLNEGAVPGCWYWPGTLPPAKS